ncbi:MAG: MOSC domain-containing protein [Pseudomonadota bacterium]
METIATLTRRLAAHGRVDWIGLRPTRRGAMHHVSSALLAAHGLEGDHARAGLRAVTLIQGEHLPVIAALSGLPQVEPALLRRNIVVTGVNLLALRHREVRIGAALIHVNGPCAPCSRMEEALGPGGYNALRGHGGVRASVVQPGAVALGDPVVMIDGEIAGQRPASSETLDPGPKFDLPRP